MDAVIMENKGGTGFGDSPPDEDDLSEKRHPKKTHPALSLMPALKMPQM